MSNRGGPSSRGGNPNPSSSNSSMLRPGGSGRPTSGRTAAGSPPTTTNDWTGGSPAKGFGSSSLKPQSSATGTSNTPASPNPYAPAFVANGGGGGGGSTWTTPGGGASRYGGKPRSGSNSGPGTTAARALFPGEKGGSSTNLDDESDESYSGGGGGSSTLLRSNNHPEHWESYDAGASAHGSPMPSAAGTESTSRNDTPRDSPTLGGYRGDLGEKLLLDERGTDISLSLLKKDNDVSIHMLSLLYDPPVQGCELKPYVSVVDAFNRVSAVTTDEAALNLDFRWFRGQKRICSNSHSNCTKAATIQCVSCAKMSSNVIPQHLTYFCSEKCLKENWAQHKQLHMQPTQKTRTDALHEWNFDEDEDEPSGGMDKLHCKFPSILQNSWQETGSERSYVPQAEDVGRALRLECSPILKAPKKESTEKTDKSGETPITTTSQLNSELNLGTVVRIDTGAVIPTPQPPPPRTILYTDPTTPINNANTFRTVCYNVLAQIYATRQVYPYTSIWALSWEYRKNLLLREILSHHADVICLQEVQSNHFENFFQPQLSKHGYDGIFKRKTRDAGSDSSGNLMIDGCATFYKRERFALMEQYGIEFNEAAKQHTSNRTQLRRLLRGNIALVLVLEELTPPSGANSAAARRNRKRRLCITNTHIFWDPEYPDVKLWQTWVLCQELEKLVLPRNLPLVLCGDLNSLVESSVYELLSTERVEQGEDVFGSTGDPSGLLPAPHQVAHRLPLLSAYATIGEPKYTNYTGSFVGILDYIFFTRTHLRCVACLDVDDESLLRQHTALPSPHYPSDHLPLVTTLEFLD